MLVGVGCMPSPEEVAARNGRSGATDAPDTDGAASSDDEGFRIKSSVFRDGEELPEKYTADGENISPPLTFEDAPRQTEEIALVMHDPDAPGEDGFTHWVIWSLAPHIPGLPGGIAATEEVDRIGAVQGTNSDGEIGYTGPAPPEGDDPHSYEFTAYALSEEIELAGGATMDELEAAMEGKVIEETTLRVTCGR
jgi:hypothetical protein